MVVRLFLMHMVEVRPEILGFIVSSPCDCSFIPELCTSGNITDMTDSADYFVGECQPRDGSLPVTTAARIEPRSLAGALAPWATTSHRDNARHALVFHAGELSPDVAGAIAASEMFVSEVRANSPASPAPFRHHPLWGRSLDYHMTTARVEQDLTRLAAITGDPALESGTGTASHLRSILLGRAPHFRPWHPRWPDVRKMRQSVAAAGGNVAIIADTPARVRVWLDTVAATREGRPATHLRPEDLHEIAARVTQSGSGFDGLIMIADQVPPGFAEELPRIALLLKPGGALLLAIGGIFSEAESESVTLPSELVPGDGSLTLEKTAYVTKTPRRSAVQTAMMRYARRAMRPVSLWTACWLAAAGGLAAISMFFNIVAVRWRWPAKRPRFSSVFLTLRTPKADGFELPVRSG